MALKKDKKGNITKGRGSELTELQKAFLEGVYEKGIESGNKIAIYNFSIIVSIYFIFPLTIFFTSCSFFLLFPSSASSSSVPLLPPRPCPNYHVVCLVSI